MSITIYLLIDFNKLTVRAQELIPNDRKDTWLAFIKEYDFLLSRYLRGQMIAATVVGVLTWLGLWALGFPYPAVVGVVAGVFNLVMGSGAEIGSVLVDDARVAGVSFTGSVGTGQRLAQACAAMSVTAAAVSTFKPSIAEDKNDARGTEANHLVRDTGYLRVYSGKP